MDYIIDIGIYDDREIMEFQQELPDEIKGNVKKYREGAMRTGKSPIFWVSDGIEISNVFPDADINSILIEMINKYAPYLSGKDMKPTVSIVTYYEHKEEVSGIFLSSEVIKCLSDINASLDISEYLY